MKILIHKIFIHILKFEFGDKVKIRFSKPKSDGEGLKKRKLCVLEKENAHGSCKGAK